MQNKNTMPQDFLPKGGYPPQENQTKIEGGRVEGMHVHIHFVFRLMLFKGGTKGDNKKKNAKSWPPKKEVSPAGSPKEQCGASRLTVQDAAPTGRRQQPLGSKMKNIFLRVDMQPFHWCRFSALIKTEQKPANERTLCFNRDKSMMQNSTDSPAPSAQLRKSMMAEAS